MARTLHQGTKAARLQHPPLVQDLWDRLAAGEAVHRAWRERARGSPNFFVSLAATVSG